MRNTGGNVAALSQLREMLARPWVKTVVIPMLLVYFVLRPVLQFLFPRTAANEGLPGKGAAGSGSGSGSVSGSSSGQPKGPQSAESFLKQQLELALTRKRRGVPGAAGSAGRAQRRGRSSSGTEGEGDLMLPLPPAAAAEGQLSPRGAQALHSRLNVDRSSVVTVAFPASADCSATRLQELLRVLAGHVHLFVLIKLRPSEGGNNDSAQAERKRVEQSLLPLTSGSAPLVPAQRLLFSQSVTGRTAAVRQLRSAIHLDFDHDVCRTLEQHVRSIIFVNLDAAAPAGAEAGAEAGAGAGALSQPGFSQGGLIMIRNYAQLHELQL